MRRRPDAPARFLRAKYIAFAFVVVLLLHFTYGLAHRIYNAASAGELNFVADFESGDVSPWDDVGAIQVCCDDSIEIVTAPVRKGRYAARFNLRRADPDVKGSKRAEVRAKAGSNGRDYWYAFSIHVPVGWPADHVPVTLAQWHNVPDVWYGEWSLPPPLRLVVEEGQWKLANIWDAKLVSRLPFAEFKPDGYTMKSIGPLVAERWTDWQFHIRWSPGDDGVIEAWLDGQVVFQRNGSNCYNDALSPYLKVGIYVPRWKLETPTPVDRHSVLFDEIRVSDRPGAAESRPSQP